MWILGMMFFVSCSDDDNGGAGATVTRMHIP